MVTLQNLPQKSTKNQIKNTTLKIDTGRQVLSNWRDKNKLLFSEDPEMKKIFDQAIDSFIQSFDVESSLNQAIAIMVEEYPSDEHYSQAEIIIESLAQKRMDLALKRNQLVKKFFK